MIRRRWRSFVLLAGLSVFTLVIPSLAFKRQQSPAWSKLPDVEFKDVIVRLERSGCYGNCPVYKLTVQGDGRVEYLGDKYVKVVGKQEGRLEAAEVRRVVAEFEKANYFSIYEKARCSCTECSDMPTVTTEIEWRGISKSVMHYHGCTCAPKALWTLEREIDSIAHTEQWTGDVSKQGPKATTCFGK